MPADSSEAPSTSWRVVLAVISIIAVLLPFVTVDVPPAGDLPQHLDQARAFWATVGGSLPDHHIQWTAPYTLSYVPLALLWLSVPPALAGKLWIAGLVAAWVGSLHLAAALRGRPPARATLASVLVFGPALYCGFTAFMLGFPIFILWLCLLAERRGPPLLHLALTLLVAGLLYTSHLMWFGIGLAWLPVGLWLSGTERRLVWARLAGVAPWFVATLPWLALARPDVGRSSTLWFAGSPGWRLMPTWWVESIFGALGGATETILLGLLVVVAAVSAWRVLRRGSRDFDTALLVAGACLLLAAAIGPMRYGYTVRFAPRLAGPGLALVLLALPALPGIALRRAITIASVLLVVVPTTVAWARWNTEEWRPFDRLQARVPVGETVLLLDHGEPISPLRYRPFLQAHAWLADRTPRDSVFLFTAFPHQPVVQAEPPDTVRLQRLAFFADEVQPDDLEGRAFVLTRGEPPAEAWRAMRPALTPIATEAAWSLWAVEER